MSTDPAAPSVHISLSESADRPIRIVVLTYPCDAAEMLLEHLHRNGYPVAAVILQRSRSLRRLRGLRRVLGTRNMFSLVLNWLRATIVFWKRERWRRTGYYAAHAPRLVIVPHLNDVACQNALSDLQPDIAIVGAAGILRPEVFTLPRIGTLNIHPGLLPNYRGCSTVTWSVLEDAEVGVTLHLIDEGIDTGPVISQRVVPVQPGDTLHTLSRRVQATGLELLTDTLDALTRGEAVSVTRQPRAKGRYCRIASPEVCRRAEQRLSTRT